ADAGLGKSRMMKNMMVKNDDEEFSRRARSRARRQRDLLPAHATSAQGSAAWSFQGRLGPAGGFRDLHGSLCGGENCAATREMILAGDSRGDRGKPCVTLLGGFSVPRGFHVVQCYSCEEDPSAPLVTLQGLAGVR